MRAPTRRELIAGATAGAFTAAVDPAWGSLLSRRAAVGPGRFRDGVATGDPTPTAVTFWSRLRTERLRSGARLIVARDEGMRRVVATAVVPTGRGVDHTLKARVGGLEPATEYFYVWETTNGVSPVGRTRTRAAQGLGRAPADRVLVLPAVPVGLLHPAHARRRRGPRPVPLPRRLHLRAGPRAAAHRRARRPHRTPSTSPPTGSSTCSRARTPACRSCTGCIRRCTCSTTTRSRTTTPTTCPRPRRCSAAPATARRRSGSRASSTSATATGSSAACRSTPTRSCSCSTRASTARAATTACRGGSSATRRWPGCSPR